MQRYFTKKTDWDGNFVFIKGDDAHHIVRVMRKKVGDRVICNHPEGKAAICEIKQIEKLDVKVQVVEWLEENAELPIQVTIAQGLPKGNKLDFILQKGTELGASKFLLFEGERSIAKWDEKKSKQKLKRYRKILKEASEQCHRNIIPEIEVMSLQTILESHLQYDIMMYAYEEEAKKAEYSSLAKAFTSMKLRQKALILIGPEGGFSNREVQLFEKYDLKPVRLSPRILRTETAPLYALASISYHFEELRCHECQQSHSIR